MPGNTSAPPFFWLLLAVRARRRWPSPSANLDSRAMGLFPSWKTFADDSNLYWLATPSGMTGDRTANGLGLPAKPALESCCLALHPQQQFLSRRAGGKHHALESVLENDVGEHGDGSQEQALQQDAESV